jgi:small subunit ribosomal protein S20
MPIIKSAKKRVRTAAKATVRNGKTKRKLKDALKSLQRAVVSGKPENTKKLQSRAQSALDQATKKGIIHKNKAARKKSHAAKAAKAATGTSKKVVKKPAVKKVAKTTPAKKTVSTKKK